MNSQTGLIAFSLLLAVGWVAASPCKNQKCSPNFLQSPESCLCYSSPTVMKDGDDARQFCKSLGALPVEISSRSINDLISVIGRIHKYYQSFWTAHVSRQPNEERFADFTPPIPTGVVEFRKPDVSPRENSCVALFYYWGAKTFKGQIMPCSRQNRVLCFKKPSPE